MSSQEDQGEPTSPGLEAVIQKLEESLLHHESSRVEETSLSLTPRGDGQDSAAATPAAPPVSGSAHSTATPVSSRIRQIITRNLANPNPNPADDDLSLQEENRVLKEQLSQTRIDRDQLQVKQTQLTDRVGTIAPSPKRPLSQNRVGYKMY
ncbi:hypothetical protein J4Q44_G00097990 [Coregonus suidteri]|uniref:Uncharacterized protein n=1 Tax=Coregonus suidteri TaxID=861788 RepID=A0AAN8RBC5_9TELE